MPRIASTMYQDMLNFFRNQLTSVVLLALLTALINVILGYILSPGSAQLRILNDCNNISNIADMSIQQLVRNMSLEQQMVLLKAAAASTIAGIVGNVLLASGLLNMVRLTSNNQQPNSVLRAIGLSAPILPRLLLLIFLTTLLVQLGMLFIIVPGVVFAIAFSLAPVIATSDNLGTIKSMRMSASLAFANIRLLAPAVCLWLLAKAIVLLLATKLTIISSLIVAVLLNGLINLLSAILLIYLFRLYILLR
ncbi:UPF0259 membrane protein [Candidatus Moranella endobia PCVAL]|uniref:UPF0259 membrane protein MEPCIT_115 n=1 Tax=Moranella endobia (strain PCIT) TaxID=903503 RepID=F7XXE7_MOREP|nr:YciC family protein [Candidatus Moranella endobia]AEI74773.1 conserved hypothetical protein [Candidatus Moranella endobia PCIT]AGJ61430.1 UPF0259 membrane protein [Candidatus Moranella endobia PCVAL]